MSVQAQAEQSASHIEVQVRREFSRMFNNAQRALLKRTRKDVRSLKRSLAAAVAVEAMPAAIARTQVK